MSTKLEYVLKPIAELTANPRNARTHSKDQIKKIAASIKEFGFIAPAIIDKDGVLVAGHGRLEAAKKLKMAEIPCVIADHLTPEQLRAYMLADNRIQLDSGWNEDILKIELNELAGMDFDLSLTGFDLTEISGHVRHGAIEGEDDAPEPEENPVSKLGDIWILGNHRVMCGDSTKKETLELLMQGERADLVHTDPPYNVDYSNADRPKPGKKDLGKIQNDKMNDKDFYAFLAAAFKNAYDYSKKDASAYIWHSNRESVNFTKAAESVGFQFAQTIIWVKPMLLSRTRYQWAHEPCLFMVKGAPFFTDDRTKTTVWNFGGYDKSNNLHPTQKPTFLPEEAIGNSTEKNAVVLDLFGGSGSTLIACEKTNRHCRMMELDPVYVDVIIKRWQDYTGQDAINAETGKTYNAS